MSPASPPQRRPSLTDKSLLLSALAQELKAEKLRAEHSAKEMIYFEHLIQEKHSSFLSEQDNLISIRDRNNHQIASLRRRLKSLQEELEQAQTVREEEALLYLYLLEGTHGGAGLGHVGFDVDQPLGSVSIEESFRPDSSSREYVQRRQEDLVSPAPYPCATSSIKGSVSPERLYYSPHSLSNDHFDKSQYFQQIPRCESFNENRKVAAGGTSWNRVLTTLKRKKQSSLDPLASPRHEF
ncbi:hypothetical protein JCM16303_004769 [Sporobolomyces ruberrimus]